MPSRCSSPLLTLPRLRVADTVGVELGGALKNPLAIGAGMIEGAGFGINTPRRSSRRATRELTVYVWPWAGGRT